MGKAKNTAKKIVVRDAVDIEQVIDESTIPQDKQSLTDSEIVTYSTVDLRHSHLRIFSLLTTSDKEINVRLYPDEHVEDMAKNHCWTTPYAKPLQTNHDVYGDCNARFMDAWYLKHNDLKPKHGYGTLPQGVIDEFNRRGAFGEGTGSNIGMAETANLDFKRKIIDGTYLTTSQGATTESLTCNICGHSYRDFRKCTHMRGSTYPIFSEDGKTILGMKKCVPYTGPLDAVEDSVVNVPANDTSTLLVYDMKKDRVVNMDNISEYSDIFDIKDNKVNDNKQNVISNSKQVEEPLTDGKQQGLTPEQIDTIQKMIDKGLEPKRSVIENTEDNNKPEDVNKSIEDNKQPTIGGKMTYKIKDAIIKKVFKDCMKSLNVTDSDKVNEFFDSLNDNQEEVTALDIAMMTIDFISENAEANTTKDVTDQTATDEKTIVTEDGKTEPEAVGEQTSVKDSEEYKALDTEYKKALKMICDMKGINNEVPNLADIQKAIEDEKNKTTEKHQSITSFNF